MEAVLLEFPDNGRLADMQDARDRAGGAIAFQRLPEDLHLRFLKSCGEGGAGCRTRIIFCRLLDKDEDVIFRDEVGGRGDDQTLYDILQFPDVAGPRISQQDLHGTCADGFVLAQLLVVFCQVHPDQRGDILRALPQGRDFDGNDVQTIVEVFSEFSFLHQVCQVPVGGGDDTDVDRDRLDRTDGRDLPFLNDLQQFDLQVDRKL